MGNRGDNGSSAGLRFSYRPLIRVRGTAAVLVRPVGPVHAWLMHWDDVDKRTEPCVLGTCNYCLRFIPVRPMAYVAALAYNVVSEDDPWRRTILELPFSTGLNLSQYLGQSIALRRIRKNGPVEIGTFVPKTPPRDTTPHEIVPSLMRLWRLAEGVQLRLVPAEQWSMWDVADR